MKVIHVLAHYSKTNVVITVDIIVMILYILLKTEHSQVQSFPQSKHLLLPLELAFLRHIIYHLYKGKFMKKFIIERKFQFYEECLLFYLSFKFFYHF